MLTRQAQHMMRKQWSQGWWQEVAAAVAHPVEFSRESRSRLVRLRDVHVMHSRCCCLATRSDGDGDDNEFRPQSLVFAHFSCRCRSLLCHCLITTTFSAAYTQHTEMTAKKPSRNIPHLTYSCQLRQLRAPFARENEKRKKVWKCTHKGNQCL